MSDQEPVDPLDGFRGRPERDAYEALEGEVNAFRSLANNDINMQLVSEVLRADQLIVDLKNESGSMKRLVTFVAAKLDQSCKEWQEEQNPKSERAINAHTEARAARILFNWIQDTIQTGQHAEALIQNEAEEENYEQ